MNMRDRIYSYGYDSCKYIASKYNCAGPESKNKNISMGFFEASQNKYARMASISLCPPERFS